MSTNAYVYIILHKVSVLLFCNKYIINWYPKQKNKFWKIFNYMNILTLYKINKHIKFNIKIMHLNIP